MSLTIIVFDDTMHFLVSAAAVVSSFISLYSESKCHLPNFSQGSSILW